VKNARSTPVSLPGRNSRTARIEPARIAVLAGGTSAEREISLLTGKNAAEALKTAGHQVEVLDPQNLSVSSMRLHRFDAAFLALHGTFGEDGQIQQQLDELNVIYTGSGAAASSLAFHKLDAKRRFLSARLATPEYVPVSKFATPSTIMQLGRSLGFPLVVKPEAQGSSLGVSLVEDPKDLLDAVALARNLDDRVLFERAILGDEWTVPVLDDVAFPPIRITTPRSFFNFSAKYQDDETRYEVMQDLEEPLVQRTQQLAVRASQVLGCRGVSRVDIRIDLNGIPQLLEVNTLPGLTSHSLVPMSAAACGWSMSDLCEEMISAAYRAHADRWQSRAS